eukprot:7057565-Pyramimonas_sp.AAC.1
MEEASEPKKDRVPRRPAGCFLAWVHTVAPTYVCLSYGPIRCRQYVHLRVGLNGPNTHWAHTRPEDHRERLFSDFPPGEAARG